ncbi:hypothetical protein [Streptomyces zhihengii]|uniref:hypothetical protein n=1 Tax=Streptomyces zhihengii TaxID=1818004 RepID=UPI001FD3D156|nr:hypothetical protein [Streptomyces zhihengii]
MTSTLEAANRGENATLRDSGVGEGETAISGRTSNPHLALWIAATGLSHGEIARRIAVEAIRQGHRQIAPDATRVRLWVDGERPRPPVPALLAAVISDGVSQWLTPGDLGLTAAGPTLDTVQLPLLTEAAAQTLAGWWWRLSPACPTR